MSDQRSEKSGNNRKNGRNSNANGGMRFGRGVFGWVLFIGLAVMLFMLLSNQSQNYREVDLNDLMVATNSDESGIGFCSSVMVCTSVGGTAD